jgi:hypothetical protein
VTDGFISGMLACFPEISTPATGAPEKPLADNAQAAGGVANYRRPASADFCSNA